MMRKMRNALEKMFGLLVVAFDTSLLPPQGSTIISMCVLCSIHQESIMQEEKAAAAPQREQ
jgi:hypothetical protein